MSEFPENSELENAVVISFVQYANASSLDADDLMAATVNVRTPPELPESIPLQGRISVAMAVLVCFDKVAGSGRIPFTAIPTCMDVMAVACMLEGH